MQPPPSTPSWRSLNWLFVYRLGFALLLELLYWSSDADPLLADGNQGLAVNLVHLYFVLVLASGPFLLLRRPAVVQQVELLVFLDIVMSTLLMHASGGVATGLGVLPAIAVIAGALLLEGRLSLLFASFATLAVITQQIYSQLYDPGLAATYTQAGLLGITYFAVAILAHTLLKRIHESEGLAARRLVDIDDLSTLNEYIIRSISTGVVVVDGERRVRLINDAARHLLGIGDTDGRIHLDRRAPVLSAWLAAAVSRPQGNEQTIKVNDLELKPTLKLLGDVRNSGALLFLRDNEEINREAQQIKLASLGRLTASIAHNIRNPLSAVSHAAQLLGESEDMSPVDARMLAIIRRNCARIDEIVTSVLQLSRREQLATETIDLNQWLRIFSSELRDIHEIDQDHLSLELNAETPLVDVDTRHLDQILRNLCENALVHATRDGAPPHILLRTRQENHGKPVMVEVIDDGPGIPADQAEEIFEPFFTTSASGTGLGLYAAREFALANRIDLKLFAAEESGCRFRLTFNAYPNTRMEMA